MVFFFEISSFKVSSLYTWTLIPFLHSELVFRSNHAMLRYRRDRPHYNLQKSCFWSFQKRIYITLNSYPNTLVMTAADVIPSIFQSGIIIVGSKHLKRVLPQSTTQITLIGLQINGGPRKFPYHACEPLFVIKHHQTSNFCCVISLLSNENSTDDLWHCPRPINFRCPYQLNPICINLPSHQTFCMRLLVGSPRNISEESIAIALV